MKYNELRHTHGETATDSDDHSGDDSSSAASPASVHSRSKDTFVCDILFRCDSVMVDVPLEVRAAAWSLSSGGIFEDFILDNGDFRNVSVKEVIVTDWNVSLQREETLSFLVAIILINCINDLKTLEI